MTISSFAVTNPAETTNALKHLTDAELVSVARESEGTAGAAFGELVRRYQRMVYALAASLVRPSDAEDVVQETFLRAFRNLDLLGTRGDSASGSGGLPLAYRSITCGPMPRVRRCRSNPTIPIANPGTSRSTWPLWTH